MAAPVPARPASTVMLLRGGAEAMEVLMLGRTKGASFAAGALVFPGGRVDAEDAAIAADPALFGPHGARWADNPEEAARRVAAIRETFEEAGILLARPHGAPQDAPPIAAAPAPEPDFATLLRAHRLQLAPDLLVKFAHWITPVTTPKRFDTHFYLAQAPAGQTAAADGGETVSALWIEPAAAVAAAQAGTHPIVFPTQMNLALLDRLATTAEQAMAVALQRRIVTVTPELLRITPEGRLIRIPPEAGYGGPDLLVTNMPSA